MRVLVTGGSGFIGSHVVDALARAGHEVVSLDRRRREGTAPPPSGAVTEVVADLADLADPGHPNHHSLAAIVSEVDAVSHQASRVGLGTDFGDVCSYVSDNDVGTGALLRVLHDSRYSGRLVLASSMVVYGEGRYLCGEHGPVRPGPRPAAALAACNWEPPCPTCGGELTPEPVDEDAPLDPRSVYAATKVHQEHLCLAFGREHDVAVTALRYHNVYGPRMPDDTPYAGVAAIFRSALAAGRSPQVFEDGGQRRDFVHVSDVATANICALTADAAASGAFNVASGEPHTIGELAGAMAASFGGEAHAPVITGRWRDGDVRHVVASSWRAERMLGFRARVAFSEGIGQLASDTP